MVQARGHDVPQVFVRPLVAFVQLRMLSGLEKQYEILDLRHARRRQGVELLDHIGG
jgi:hypothetical protein